MASRKRREKHVVHEADVWMRRLRLGHVAAAEVLEVAKDGLLLQPDDTRWLALKEEAEVAIGDSADVDDWEAIDIDDAELEFRPKSVKRVMIRVREVKNDG